MQIRLRFLLLGLLCASPSLHGQLAITEVMSSAANTYQGAPVTQASDFWELTNFGPTPLDLNGYKWTDDTTLDPTLADPTPFVGVTIQPGESVIVLFTNVTPSEAAFRAWWGPSAASVRVLGHGHRGFSSGGDGARLWDANNQLVDDVAFGSATRGRTFTYDPVTGLFGQVSVNGVGGAFAAATADDVGSPGTTSGLVPIAITQPPTNLTVTAGSPATLRIAAQGVPRVRYQWLFEGTPLPGQTGASFVLTNAQPANAGNYRVVLTNGVQVLTSAVARLTVSAAPTAPVVTLLPQDLTAYANQTAAFSVAAIGNPNPQYQWRFAGADIPFETSPQLTIYGVTEASAGTYSVRVYNSAGSTNVSAQLTITTKPRLVITEVMSSQGTNAANVVVGQDWWEISNLDTFPVNLRGWRWDDDETLAGAFVITNDVTLHPGDSAVLSDGLTPEAFRAWWGPANLSPDLPIIRYTGNGLSSLGDIIALWNAAATEDSDRVATTSFAAATAGVSFGFNSATEEFGLLSIAGQFGAFKAATGNDLGSPGYLWNRPVILSLASSPAGVDLTWSTRANVNYAVRAAADLSGPWNTLSNRLATGSTLTFRDATAAGNRFYRVVENP
jgi:hypothetical protein